MSWQANEPENYESTLAVTKSRRNAPTSGFVCNASLLATSAEISRIIPLKERLEAAEFQRFKERHFKDRVKRVARHFRDNDWPAEKQAEFRHLIMRLDSIRALRNHIAHAHMLIRLEPETNTLVPSASLPKDLDQEYSPEARHVTFDELRTSLNELTELIETFKRLAGFNRMTQSVD